MNGTKRHPALSRLVRVFTSVNVFVLIYSALIVFWTQVSVTLFGLPFGISIIEFCDSVARQFLSIWAGAIALLYAGFCFSIPVYAVHAWLYWFVVPDQVNDLGEALCADVIAETVPVDPSVKRYPGYYSINEDAAYLLYENYDLWNGSCSFEAGSYGLNGGPNGEEFFIEFRGRGNSALNFRHRFEFSLPWNLFHAAPWNKGRSDLLMIRDSSEPIQML